METATATRKITDRPAGKAGLRAWAKKVRAAMPLQEVSHWLTERLLLVTKLRQARSLLIYRAMPDEVDVSGLLDTLPDTDFYLPRCAPERRLAIHRFIPGETPLRSGPFGIAEPDPDRVPETDALVLDAVIVPALLLTPRGDRLGYGGGYYDRFLPRLRSDCLRLGVLPDALVVDTLPTDPWDAPLDCIVTESQMYCRQRNGRVPSGR